MGDLPFFVPRVDIPVFSSTKKTGSVLGGVEAVQEVGGGAPCFGGAFAGLGAESQGAVVTGGDEFGVFLGPNDRGNVAGMSGDEHFLFARFCVPNFQLFVGPSAGDGGAVRFVGEAEDGGGVGFDLFELLAIGQVPKSDELIFASGGEGGAGWCEGEGEDGTAVGRPAQALGQGGGFPEGDLSRLAGGVAGGDERLAVGAEGEGGDASGKGGDLAGRLPVAGVPEDDFPESPGGQVFAVGTPRDGLDDIAVTVELGQAGRCFLPHTVNEHLVAVTGGELGVVRREGEGEHRAVSFWQGA